ncbi:hypothetical protein CDAR_296941 [Caerostris darwini]|uniref:Uncharacterized protein n=1 Tax=Caerostris darwini TaxID=1538125 RepID=A0AAV4UNV7_9ARAC|nr:hypothetical protein CDAR_296941 [Caerostris darwini]
MHQLPVYESTLYKVIQTDNLVRPYTTMRSSCNLSFRKANPESVDPNGSQRSPAFNPAEYSQIGCLHVCLVQGHSRAITTVAPLTRHPDLPLTAKPDSACIGTSPAAHKLALHYRQNMRLGH